MFAKQCEGLRSMTMASLNAGSESILKKGRKDWRLNGEAAAAKRRSKKLPKEAEEDLIAENQRLRAEIDYLKNLQALVLEEERRQHRKRR